MLLTRDEMSFDFRGATLDPVRDRKIIGWMLNQFLYGEVTGIQIGHWLYDAPDLTSARFLARQAVEEFQHVDNILRIMAMLGVEPEKPNGMVTFLATGMMGGSWAEHVALEMASGEVALITCPASRMLPPRAGRKPTMEWIVVDLPAPLRPSSASRRPSSNCHEMPCSTWLSP